MNPTTPQKESRVVLAILASVFVGICVILCAVGFILATRANEITYLLATSIEGTATPTRTVTPTSTPIAPFSWKNVLFDSFDQAEHGWMQAIQDGALGAVKYGIHDGMYSWTFEGKGEWGERVVVPEMPAVTDFYATTDVVGTVDGQVGLVFHYVDEKNYYRFLADRDGTFRVDLMQDGELKPLVKGMPKSNAQVASPRQLEVYVRGDKMVFLINNQEVATTKDDRLASGKVGLVVVMTPEKEGEIAFDDFRVTGP